MQSLLLSLAVGSASSISPSNLESLISQIPVCSLINESILCAFSSGLLGLHKLNNNRISVICDTNKMKHT